MITSIHFFGLPFTQLLNHKYCSFDIYFFIAQMTKIIYLQNNIYMIITWITYIYCFSYIHDFIIYGVYLANRFPRELILYLSVCFVHLRAKTWNSHNVFVEVFFLNKKSVTIENSQIEKCVVTIQAIGRQFRRKFKKKKHFCNNIFKINVRLRSVR